MLSHLKNRILIVFAALMLPLSLSAQQSPLCAHVLFCLINQEAIASTPEGIHTYSKDLIGLIVPYDAEKVDLSQLVDRLARAEQMARSGKGKLVAEADIVRAFNELMIKIGAPPTLRANEAAMRSFREHANSIKAFPELFSAGRNGNNCNPGEAVFLLSLLLVDDGILYEKNLDSAQTLISANFQQTRGGSSFAHVGSVGSIATRLLSGYTSMHKRDAITLLFNHIADGMGF
jgi:hypothetical protein